jgi:hypothetical protein
MTLGFRGRYDIRSPRKYTFCLVAMSKGRARVDWPVNPSFKERLTRRGKAILDGRVQDLYIFHMCCGTRVASIILQAPDLTYFNHIQVRQRIFSAQILHPGRSHEQEVTKDQKLLSEVLSVSEILFDANHRTRHPRQSICPASTEGSGRLGLRNSLSRTQRVARAPRIYRD